MGPDIFMVAGEASADLHAAALVKELRCLYPDLRLFGIGGDRLKAEGMEVKVDSSSLNVVGGMDWIDKVGQVLRAYRDTLSWIKKRPPTIAILLDLPDFNLRLAKKLKKAGVPVVYYISPQVWAWRKYRVHQIRRDIEKMLVLFPFEKEFYRDHGVEAEFVGHPLLETLSPRTTWRSQAEVLAAPRIAILPGSRHSEIRFGGPALSQLIHDIRSQFPTAEIQVPLAKTLQEAELRECLGGAPVTYTRDSWQTLKWSDLAVVASGTATLETALVGTPFCLYYRVSKSSAWVFKHLMNYRGPIGMPNILLGKVEAKEFFQEAATAGNLFEEVTRLIKDESYREQKGQALLRCRSLLGEAGASARAAKEIHKVLQPLTGVPPHGLSPH